MSSTLLAWAALICGYLLPLFHVALSAKSGPWRPPPGSTCPLGPRTGWLVMVLLLGPIGWLLFLSARFRRRAGAPTASQRRGSHNPDSRPNS
jgi:hypothetical protein